MTHLCTEQSQRAKHALAVSSDCENYVVVSNNLCAFMHLILSLTLSIQKLLNLDLGVLATKLLMLNQTRCWKW